MSDTFEFDTFLANGFAHVLSLPLYIAAAIGNAATEVDIFVDGIKNYNSVQAEHDKKAGEMAKAEGKKDGEIPNVVNTIVDPLNNAINGIANSVERVEGEVVNPGKKVEPSADESNIVKPESEVMALLPEKDFSITGKEKVAPDKIPNKLKEIMDKWGFLYSVNIGQGNLMELEIYRNNMVDKYTIETGDLFGRGINIIYTLPNNAILPINISEDEDIAERVLLNINYPLSQDEVNRAISRMLPNYNLYRWFDTKGLNLAKLNSVDINKLSNKLTAIINIYAAVDPNNIPRFRFTKVKNVDNFKLVSDEKVNRPKIYVDNNLISNIINGESISINKDKIIITDAHGKNARAYMIRNQ